MISYKLRYDSGIDIRGFIADSNTIQDNSISHNSEGISIHSSSNNTLARNIIKNNKFSGIDLEHAMLSSISENVIGGNGRGIYLIASNENAIRDNLIQGNREEGILLSSYLSEYGPYGFSDNNTLSGNDIRDNEYGIFLGYSENNTINGNKLINNSYGLYLKHSKNNSIMESIFINNAQNLSSDDRSREGLAGDASGVVAMVYGFLYILIILIMFINGLILVLIGAAVGFAARILLKDQSLSLVASLILGALGSLIGYFVYDNFISSSDGVAYLIAIVFAAVLVIAASLIAGKRRGGS